MENERTYMARLAFIDRDLSKLEGREDPAAAFARGHLLAWRNLRGRDLPLDYINTMDPRVDPGSTRALAELAKTGGRRHGVTGEELARAKHVLNIATMVAAIAAEADYPDDQFPGASELFELRWAHWARANSVDAGQQVARPVKPQRSVVTPENWCDPENAEAFRAQQRKNYPNSNLPSLAVPRRSTVG